jgi:hypothetical protein
MDFISAIIELSGSWIVGNKKKIGFLILALSNLCWIGYVLIAKVSYGLLLVVMPAFIINIRNFIKWKKSESK